MATTITLKQLEGLLEKCKQECLACGIQYGNIANIEINARARKRWGQIRYNNLTKTYSINISKRILTDKTPVEKVKQVIHHELCHSVEGCWNHGQKWKSMADRLNRRYGYDIKRTDSSETFGLSNQEETDDFQPYKSETVKYIFECRNCGQLIKRKRMSEFVRHPENYSCGKCGGSFKRVRGI